MLLVNAHVYEIDTVSVRSCNHTRLVECGSIATQGSRLLPWHCPECVGSSGGRVTRHTFSLQCGQAHVKSLSGVQFVRLNSPNMADKRRLMLAVLLAVVFSAVEGTEEFQFKHHDNEELATILENVHLRCPNITRVYTLSENSVAGNPLLLIEFSDKPGRHELRKLIHQ